MDQTENTVTPAPETPVAAAPEAPAAASADEAHKKKHKGHKEQLAELEAKVAEQAAKIAELQDRHLRLLAELDNLRKRGARDVNDARVYGKYTALEAIVQVVDHFNMAMNSINSAGDVASVKQGMRLIADEFTRCFEGLGVERIATVGKPFDPALHEAVTMEHSAEVPENHVIREWRAGFRIGERLLRAPVVVVSRGPAAAPAATPETAAAPPPPAAS